MSKRFDSFLFDNNYRWIGHVFFWVFIYLDEILSVIGLTAPFDKPWENLYYLAIDMIFVYFIIYVLIPRFLIKRKYSIFILLTFISILMNVGISAYLSDITDTDYSIASVMIELFILNASMFGLAIALKLFKIFYTENIENQNLKTLQHETELSFLKNQINPHFLFNALNSVYVMAQKKDEDLPDAILDLSDLLRYQTYDSNKHQVGLKEEMDFIKNYFDFEKIRRKNLVIIQKAEGNASELSIAPLLLLPLAENALKYSVSTNDEKMEVQSLIQITDKEFIYYVSNTIGNPNLVNDDAYSGIGLTNLKRRLALIYPDNYSLDIDHNQDKFNVRLAINKTKLLNG